MWDFFDILDGLFHFALLLCGVAFFFYLAPLLLNVNWNSDGNVLSVLGNCFISAVGGGWFIIAFLVMIFIGIVRFFFRKVSSNK